MAASAFEAPIRFQVKPSIWLSVFIYLSHLAAFLACWHSSFPLVISSLAVLLSFFYCRQVYIASLSRDPLDLLLNGKGEWYLIDAHGTAHLSELLPESFVHPYLVILRFKGEAGKRTVILTPDVTSAHDFRRLSVRLRFSLNQEK